jgi:3-oxoacyl-[acyl-carrier-protein] synthase II
MTRAAAVITGLGPVSAVGTGVERFWSSLIEGHSGLSPLSRCAPVKRGCEVAAEVADPPALPIDVNHPWPRAVQLALHAAKLARDDAGLEANSERAGVIVGTGVGNLDALEAALEEQRRGARLSPSFAFRSFTHAAACEIVRELDLRGPIATLSSGCNSGMDALGLALDWIRLGRADAVLVGGVEAELTPLFLSMMGAARALAVRYNDSPSAAMRPFDRGRDGNIPGEGAAFLVVESAEHAARRGARVRGMIEGFACRAVGRRVPYDPFNPVFDPAPMVRAMRGALEDAAVAADQVGAVSANGSSSVFYDRVEARAITDLLGRRVPVHSVKSVLGQTGAVIPVLQAIAATLSIERGLLPPTINAGDLDPECTIDLVRDQPRAGRFDHLLCNAIGFGGFYYASLLIARA